MRASRTLGARPSRVCAPEARIGRSMRWSQARTACGARLAGGLIRHVRRLMIWGRTSGGVWRPQGASRVVARVAGPDAAHTKAPEGTDGKTGQSARRWLRTSPESPALLPSPSLAGLAALEPRTQGPFRGSLPGAVWRFAPAPSGKRNVVAGVHRPQRPYPRTDGGRRGSYPRACQHCG